MKLSAYLSILPKLDGGAALVLQKHSLGGSRLQLDDGGEVAVHVVVGQHVAARAGEGQVAPVEREDVLAVDYYGADCRERFDGR